MKLLELYINGEAGGFHNFIVVDGTHRLSLEPSFSVQSVDDMLLHAKQLIEGGGYEERLRVYDPHHKMVRGGDGIAWVTLKQLKLWTLPQGMRQPQANESVLGRALETVERALGPVAQTARS